MVCPFTSMSDALASHSFDPPPYERREKPKQKKKKKRFGVKVLDIMNHRPVGYGSKGIFLVH